MSMRRQFGLALGALAGGALLPAAPDSAQAQVQAPQTQPTGQPPDSWPNRPIKMIVPFPPGGVADLVGRPVAAALEKRLGQPVLVDNRAGAGGGVGMAAAANAPTDGYTLLMALSSIAILPEADRVLGRSPMYQLSGFVPVARFTADPVVLAVRADAPWKSVADLLADARRRPGVIPYGSSGNYGTMHVPMEMFAARAGVKLLHVPYGGAGPAVVGLLGGQVDLLATGPSSVLSQVQGGKLRLLACSSPSRLAAFPDLPTLRELGLDVEFSQWAGLFAPAGTPEPVLNRLRAASRDILADPQLVQRFATMQTPIQYLDAPQFKQFWEKEADTLGQVVRQIGKVE